ncbi:hypothetical protein WOLCODRAFT_165513, partial [Wolfiporia cocos MD-104 SS10]
MFELKKKARNDGIQVRLQALTSRKMARNFGSELWRVETTRKKSDFDIIFGNDCKASYSVNEGPDIDSEYRDTQQAQYDPVDDILNYILENSSVTSAIADTDDFASILQLAGAMDITHALRDLSPKIIIKKPESTGRISLEQFHGMHTASHSKCSALNRRRSYGILQHREKNPGRSCN